MAFYKLLTNRFGCAATDGVEGNERSSDSLAEPKTLENLMPYMFQRFILLAILGLLIACAVPPRDPPLAHLPESLHCLVFLGLDGP